MVPVAPVGERHGVALEEEEQEQEQEQESEGVDGGGEKSYRIK